MLLIAIGYYLGTGGEYATPARNFIDQGTRAFLASLSERDRARFDEILANVRIKFGNQKSPIV